VSVVDKQVYLNNELIKLEDFPKTDALVNRITQQNGDNNYYGPQIKITKNGDVSHLMQITTKNSPLSNYEEIIIPEGHFFVMGDNRDNSADSRDWGLVPFENIKGKAFLVWFNLNLPFLQPDGVAETPFMFFPERIGKLVY
jgi:signal peptidase I